MKAPLWLVQGNELQRQVFPATLGLLKSRESPDALHESIIPEVALFHVSDCMEASIQTNAAGQHSVAITLLRGCLEALTLVDLGLQANEYRIPKLQEWAQDEQTAGNIRRGLENDVWPRYGQGIWDEPWGRYFGNLSRAFHPYAHYSRDLMGWQWSVLSMDSRGKGIVVLGPPSYDPLKATRITLLHTLLVWTVGRLAVLNAGGTEIFSLAEAIEKLRSAIGESGLLFKEGDWGVELMPHVWFKKGVDWRRNA